MLSRGRGSLSLSATYMPRALEFMARADITRETVSFLASFELATFFASFAASLCDPCG
jgi:hypothetical protein